MEKINDDNNKKKEKKKKEHEHELASESIGLGKAFSRACITSSYCFNGSKFLAAMVAASTKLSYPLFLFINPAKSFSHAMSAFHLIPN